MNSNYQMQVIRTGLKKSSRETTHRFVRAWFADPESLSQHVVGAKHDSSVRRQTIEAQEQVLYRTQKIVFYANFKRLSVVEEFLRLESILSYRNLFESDVLADQRIFQPEQFGGRG